ncbi:hypothetical protein [Nitratidesulfovibrio sp. 1201_IL3209]|uniref:hypothetical protein n=1 Tax=Nitratidesulfovibrio sp. 1201_IL3209 TaxID=3084053 RepID=UPI002FDB7AE2
MSGSEGKDRFDTSGFVMRKQEVGEADAAMTVSRAGRRPSFDPAAERIVILGLPGSGRRRLAELVAERFGMQAAAPEDDAAPGVVTELCCRTGLVLAAPVSAVRDEQLRACLRDGARVFYMMTNPVRLAAELGLSGEAGEKFCRDALELETLCMGVLHFLLPDGRSPEQLVVNVCENLGVG